MYKCGLNNQSHLGPTLVQFLLECSPDHLLKWFEHSDLNPSRKRFRGNLLLVFLLSDSYSIRENALSDQV